MDHSILEIESSVNLIFLFYYLFEAFVVPVFLLILGLPYGRDSVRLSLPEA